MKLTRLLLAIALSLTAWSARADGTGDNSGENVRRQPPPGKPISPEAREELERGRTELEQEIAALQGELKNRPALLDLLPDVRIFHKAVQYALEGNEFRRWPTFFKNLLRPKSVWFSDGVRLVVGRRNSASRGAPRRIA